MYSEKQSTNAASEDVETIPAFRPLLPTAEYLLPYLRRIDQTRVYANFGPLVIELERRLAGHLRVPVGGIVSASSGFAALVGAIIATAGRARPERPYALLPAFTFVATAAAVEACGYTPYLADVAGDTWALDPEQIATHPELDKVGLVVPVSTFGRGISESQWRGFVQRTGVKVVIDGAAAFDRLVDEPDRYLGRTPVVVSFHATKSFSTGEGGCVISTDIDLIARAAAALNFGFSGTRNSVSASLNGKMSEYHAAVGLAELDSWPRKSAAMQRVVADYVRFLRDAGLLGRFYSAPTVGSCYALFLCTDGAETHAVCQSLTRHRIDFRFWYGSGVQGQTYYRDCQRGSLAITESLAARIIGLPFGPDLNTQAIQRVVAALADGQK